MQRTHLHCSCSSQQGSGPSTSARGPSLPYRPQQQRRLLGRRVPSVASEGNGASTAANGVPRVERVERQVVNRALGFSSAEEEDFCIIETSETVKDFAGLGAKNISDNIQARRNRIFLLMEEVRRLRIQQRVQGVVETPDDLHEKEEYNSALPFLPPLTEATLSNYYAYYILFFAGVIAFGGIVSPILEVKLGLGGLSYSDFVLSVHLPAQLAQVDPIVASFCGGAVGVLTALLVVEVNNVKKQQKIRCLYCDGIGYLTCGHCVGSGQEPEGGGNCRFCAGTSKVMCTSCLCTGKQLATEHDPRASPF